MTWQTKKLGEVCEILIGGTPRREVADFWKNGIFPWVSIRDMSREGDVIEKTAEKITEKGVRNSNVKLIPKGSLLFSFKLSIGKLAFAGSDLYTNEAIAGLVIKDKNQLDKNFLYYYMSQMSFGEVTTAVKGNTLNKEKIKNLEIPLPPLKTQKEIVGKLDAKFAKLREVKRLREEALADTEKILSRTLHEIFEAGKKKGWEEMTLGSLFDITSSKRVFKSEWTKTGIPFYRAREIVSLAKNKPFKTPIFVSEKMYETYASKYGVPKEGDILVTGVGTLGISYTVKKDDKFYFKDGNIIWLKKISNTDSNYVQHYFHSDLLKDQIKAHAGGATVLTFTIRTAKATKIPLPPLTEQKQIVTKLDTLSEKVRNLRELQKSQLADLKALEKAYLREAFQGEM